MHFYVWKVLDSLKCDPLNYMKHKHSSHLKLIFIIHQAKDIGLHELTQSKFMLQKESYERATKEKKKNKHIFDANV